MMIDILKRSMTGIAFGGIVTFIALTILTVNDINPPVSQIWLYMLASFAIGIYFGIASFIFEKELWSPLKKTIIHFSLSITFYFIIALSVGWVPFTFWAIISSVFIFIFIYIIFWIVLSTYYKKVAASLNESLKKT